MSLSPTIARAAAEAAMAEGLQVAVFTRNPQAALKDIREQLQPDHVARTCLANGAERIDLHSGGTIQFARHTAQFRGNRAHLLIVPIGTSQNDMLDMLPMNPTEIVGYY